MKGKKRKKRLHQHWPRLCQHDDCDLAALHAFFFVPTIGPEVYNLHGSMQVTDAHSTAACDQQNTHDTCLSSHPKCRSLQIFLSFCVRTLTRVQSVIQAQCHPTSALFLIAYASTTPLLAVATEGSRVSPLLASLREFPHQHVRTMTTAHQTTTLPNRWTNCLPQWDQLLPRPTSQTDLSHF